MNGPVGRRMKAMVVTGGEIDDAVVEVIGVDGLQLVFVPVDRAWFVRRDVRHRKVIQRTEETAQRICHTFHLFDHSVFNLSAVENSAVGRARLEGEITGSRCKLLFPFLKLIFYN